MEYVQWNLFHGGRGSASELEYHPILARELVFLDDDQQGALGQATTEVKRMLTGLVKKLKADR
ncbi:four helix bundle protein [Candidatus Bipolaricaulota bacterium]